MLILFRPIVDYYLKTVNLDSFGVHIGDLDCVALCRLINTAISTRGFPAYLGSDNDPLFRYYSWQTNLRIPDVGRIASIVCTPCQHPFSEPTTRTIRRAQGNNSWRRRLKPVISY